MFCKTDLMKRGWTNGLIAKFLSVPDQTKTNPYYKNAAPMRLYLKSRVEEIEASKCFKEAQNKAERRVKGANKAIRTKREKTLQFARGLNTEVEILSRKELTNLACEHYNSRNRNPDWWATPNSDEQFLNRICVNYLRHVQSEYESSLWQLKGKTGIQTACSLIRNDILDNIATKYPWLAEECENQKRMVG